MENDRKLLALDLILEDLSTKNLSIRNLAKQLGCEIELDEWRDILLNYMLETRKNLTEY